jgi:hypothetical protein
VAGVAGAGVAGAGVVEDPPDEPSEEPPMFGQSLVEWPAPAGGLAEGSAVPGVVDGSVVVPGAVEGAGLGLAAFTIAAAPPTRSSAETPAVRTARRMPLGRVTGAAGSTGVVGGAGTAGVAGGAGVSGSGVHSMCISRFEGSVSRDRSIGPDLGDAA